jgi:hypothetical protein
MFSTAWKMLKDTVLAFMSCSKEGARDERQDSSVRYCDLSLSIFS